MKHFNQRKGVYQTIIPQNGSKRYNYADLLLHEAIRTRADLAIVAVLKTMAIDGALGREKTVNQLYHLLEKEISSKKISQILVDLRIDTIGKRTAHGYRYSIEHLCSKVCITSLPRYSVDDLKRGKPIDTLDFEGGFVATYISSLKRFKLPANRRDAAVHHPYFQAALKLFRERYDLDFYDHLFRYHNILDESILVPAPEYMEGYCLRYPHGTPDKHGYRSISSYHYKNKNNPNGPSLHTAQAHRLVSLVYHFEYDFGGRGTERFYDVHHQCEIPDCVNPLHLIPITMLAHRQFHQGILADNHPFDTDNSAELPTLQNSVASNSDTTFTNILTTHTDAELTAAVSIH